MGFWKKRDGKWSLTLTGKEALAGILFIMPFLIGFFGIFLPMVIESIRFSISNMEVSDTGYVLRGTD